MIPDKQQKKNKWKNKYFPLHKKWSFPWKISFFAQCLYLSMYKYLSSYLTLSWRRPLSYGNQSIDLLCKSKDWFLHDNGPRHERVNLIGLGVWILHKKSFLENLIFCAVESIWGQFSISLAHENARKTLVFWRFQRVY